MNRFLSLLVAALAAGLCACASQGIPLSIEDLNAARAAAAEEDWEEVSDRLRDYDVDEFDLATQRDYNLLAGRAADAMEDWSRAVRYYEAYILQAGPAEDALPVEERLLDYGRRLLAGELRVFWIFTDRSRGVLVLENVGYAGRFAETRALALAELGEYRWSKEQWGRAAPYYAGLLAPELGGQGWEDLAAFRLAMSTFRQLEADRTFLDGTLEAIDQLDAYLAAFPGGLHRVEAEEAREEAREMLARHHLEVGDFYRRVDNEQGSRFHWEIAAGLAPDGDRGTAELVSGTEASRVAEERLAELAEKS